MKLRHPNILQLYDFNQSPSDVYMIIELCAGGDLQKFLKNKCKLCESVANKFFYQIAHGVQFLHENGVAHRDLKPANILLSEESGNAIIKIGDFGLSKMIDISSLAQTLCGTPLYSVRKMKHCLLRSFTSEGPTIALAIFYDQNYQNIFN